MKVSATLVALLPLASAFVLHDADVFEKIEKTGRRVIDNGNDALDSVEKAGREGLKKGQTILDETKNALDEVFEKAMDGVQTLGDNIYDKIHKAGADVDAWLEGSPFEDFTTQDDKDYPQDEPPQDDAPLDAPPHRGPPRHRPFNLTIYQMIAKSNFTTKLAKFLDDYPDLIETLNSTKANYTVFAPIDSAFEKIPHSFKPSKEDLKQLLLYHVVPDVYPAARVLHSYTLPTLYEPSDPNLLGHPQRLTARLTVKGPAINFYARLVALDIFGTNGVVHGLDNVLMRPPNVATIIDLLPGTFSTLQLALGKTDIWDLLNSTDYAHSGGTLFAPSNFAFKKLGPRINAFLFSKYGQKYLKALLEYHMVVDQTLYSDAFFDASKDNKDTSAARPPYYHLDLPSALDGKHLAVDMTHYGPFISIRINGFSRVTVHDGVAKDGVIQVVSDVLIPPKRPGGSEADIYWQGEEMSVEEFKERLDPYVGENMEL